MSYDMGITSLVIHSRHLEFLDVPKPHKIVQIDPKVIKTNKETLKLNFEKTLAVKIFLS